MAFYAERGVLLFGNLTGLCMLSFHPKLPLTTDKTDQSTDSGDKLPTSLLRWSRAIAVAELHCHVSHGDTAGGEARGICSVVVTTGFALQSKSQTGVMAPAVAVVGCLDGSVLAVPVAETGRAGEQLHMKFLCSSRYHVVL
jgi:hypothetical protein